MASGPSHSPTSNPFEPSSAHIAPRRRSSLVVGIAIGVVACMCLCTGLCAVPAGFGLFQALSQRDDVAQVLDACLQDIQSKRTEEALAKFSSRAVEQQLVTKEQIENLRDSKHFQNYQSLSLNKIHLSKTFNTDPKTPQGTVASVSGSVTYRDGGKGAFQAILEKEGDQWRLFSLQVQRSGGRVDNAKFQTEDQRLGTPMNNGP